MTAKIDDLIAKSSIGAALADVKTRGIDAHLIDLDRDLHPRRRAKKPASPTRRPTEAALVQGLGPTDAAFMRGFGCAIADVWRLHHDGQMVRHLINANGFTLGSFRDAGMLDADYEAICQAVKR
jgi:hypothetical protein